MSKEKGVNVQVLLRCRPFSNEELRNNAPQVVTCNEYQREVAVSQNIAGKQIDRVFTFDKVFGPSAQQKDLYEQSIVPIVKEVLEGFNCTIFAYGQTGTGKTYTMEGECKRGKCASNRVLPPGAGVIPRAVKQIFDTLEGQHAEYSVKVTFLELYNEEITDLLAPEDISKISIEDKQKKQLPLMEDGKGGVLVRGLEEEIVANSSEIFTLLERGSAKRRTSETLLNKQSSRSHSLFSITIHIKETTPEGEELIKCGKLNLVDLAGSENISRSGAREDRAREAGEINKSLLTLGRVISALVGHLGHVPYRDSKLTRLLRDSLGGRTKTCIIATVSPAVHCLEETLSTLDYAHRAKNIRNKPEVNQKMMKSTLIKDLYGEIERLKGELYAAREKNGVYIPKERYYQEETERKTMAEQIELMCAKLEDNQKKNKDLHDKVVAAEQESVELANKLGDAQKELQKTSQMLANTEENLRQCQYIIKERDYVCSEQKKAENQLARLACDLRADLEKSLKDNASLFMKIAREDKLNADNRSTVSKYQAELSKQLGSLGDTVAASIIGQNEHLQSVQRFCDFFLEAHEKAVTDIKEKVSASRKLCVSNIGEIQNVILLYKDTLNASLEDISTQASSNAQSIQEYLATEAGEASSIFDQLHNTLTTHQGEMAHFARELRQRFSSSTENLINISGSILGFFDKLVEESKGLGKHSIDVDVIQSKTIDQFQKTYKEQCQSDAEKLITDVTSLISNHMRQQKELVDSRLGDLRETVTANKMFLEGHVSSMEGITADAKRKWQDYFSQAENDIKDNADFSAAKHCRMELLLQKSESIAGSAQSQEQRTQESVNNKISQYASAIDLLVRDLCERNEQHVDGIKNARSVAEIDITRNSENISHAFEVMSEQERGHVSAISVATTAHLTTLEDLHRDHSLNSNAISQKAHDIFEQEYKDYEKTGSSPVRCEPDIPSKDAIESLRSMPIDALLEEFRENHPYGSFPVKEVKPLVPRSPLRQIN